jgi:hypothetical protein
MTSEEHIVIHEPGKPFLSNILPLVSASLVVVGLVAESRWAFSLGISVLVIWVLYRLKLVRDRSRDDAKAIADNYRCSRCGHLLRHRTYGRYTPDGSHARCFGLYCYECKDFDKAAMGLILKKRETQRSEQN